MQAFSRLLLQKQLQQRSASLLFRNQAFFSLYIERKVHPRGYNTQFDNYDECYNNLNGALIHAGNTDDIAFRLRRAKDTVTHTQIAYAIKKIANHNLERSPSFWEFVFPLVKD